MTEISRFWDGTTTGDSTDAPYDAAIKFSEVIEDIIPNLINTDDIGGVIFGALNQLVASSPIANTVRIDTGRALPHGHWYRSSATVDFNIPTPSVSTRIDRIILKEDTVAHTVRLTRVAGVEGSGNPPALVQTAGTEWDTRLWQVSITTGAVITLIDERTFIPISLPFVELINNSGATVNPGDVVVLDTTQADSFKTTTSADNANVLGVVANRSIPNGQDGLIFVSDGEITNIHVNGTTAIGDWIATSTAAGQGAPSATRKQNAYARALEARTGAGLVKAVLLGTVPVVVPVFPGITITGDLGIPPMGDVGITNTVSYDSGFVTVDLAMGTVSGGPSSAGVAAWILVYCKNSSGSMVPMYIPAFQ